MDLIRRGARIMWIGTRLLKFNEKYKSHILNEMCCVSQICFFHLHVQSKSNSQYESNSRSNNLITSKTNSAQDPQKFAYPEITSESYTYADVKIMVNRKHEDLSLMDETFALRLLEVCRDMLPDANLETRQELLQAAWGMLEKLGQTFTVEHYNILLSIHAKNSQYINAEEFLSTMKATPNKDTYRLLLNATAEIGDYVQVQTIITKIKDIGYPIDEATFNSLMLAYCINADIDRAQAVLDTMQAARIKPNSASYCALSRGFAAKGDITNLRRTLKDGNLNTIQFMSVIKTLSTSGHGKHIVEVMGQLPKGVYIESNDYYIHTIVELTHLGKAKDAFEVVNSLPVQRTSIDASVGFADFFLYELVKSDTPMEEVLEICRNLVSSKKNPSALLKVTEATLRLQKEAAAFLAFEAMRNNGFEIRPHFYWPLFLNAGSNKGETHVMKLVKHMIDNKVHLDDETLSNYIIPYLSMSDPLMIVRQLQDSGVKISQLITPLLAALLNTGNLRQAITLTDKIIGKVKGGTIIKHLLQGYSISRNADHTARLLSNLNLSSGYNGKFLMDLIANETVSVTNEELGALIFAFDKKKLTISRSSADALESRITRIMKPENLQETFKELIETEPNPKDAVIHAWIPHPRDMTVEELEGHLVCLSTGGGMTRGVLRRLLQAYCGKNDLEKAEQYAKMFTDQGFQWTSGMISGMFSLYTAHNMLDEADIRYKELKEKHPKFKIDDFKILDYATALIRNNKLGRALEVLAEQENVRCESAKATNCWSLINAVADAGDPNNTKRTLTLLIEKGYCRISNHLLGPLIRIHLSNGDLPAAVAEFMECVCVHKKLPLKQELLRSIVQTYTNKSEAHDQLTEVLAVIKRFHQEPAANVHLLMALAATNKQKELHNFMKMPGVNQTTLSVSAQTLTDEKDLSALRTILNACRGVKSLENTIIYDSILSLCCRSHDCKTALEIWERMQSEDISPSAQFIAKLQNLLKSHKVPLPPELVSNKSSKRRKRG